MRKSLFATLFAVAALLACKSHSNDVPAADNTAKNDRDRTATPTADKAVNGKSDLDVTQKIRQAVMADSALSTNAHNCKIVVQNGTVTLVGPVDGVRNVSASSPRPITSLSAPDPPATSPPRPVQLA